MSFACMTFFPLANATPAADDIYRDLEKSISAGIAANRYSQGLQKQYKLQLESIQRGDPVCEILMGQSYAASPNAYKKIGTAESIDSGTSELVIFISDKLMRGDLWLSATRTGKEIYHHVVLLEQPILPWDYCTSISFV